MDKPLSHGRDDQSSGGPRDNDHYGGGGRYRSYGRGRGRGRGGGRGRYRGHQPYRNDRSRGPRGGRGNRFGASAVSQEELMLRQIYSLVSRVGELKNIATSADATQGEALRPVEATTAKNIMDITGALCAPDRMNTLFAFKTAEDGSEDHGKLVSLVVSCASSLPLQTPCYAALTLAIHEQVKSTEFGGFSQRCIVHAMRHIGRDLDLILVEGASTIANAEAICRLKLLLRYLAMLAKMNIVRAYDDSDAAAGGDATSDGSQMTFTGLVCRLVMAASTAFGTLSNPTVAAILAQLVLSTVPYMAGATPPAVLEERILQPLETFLGSYQSSFVPGKGCNAILTGSTIGDDDDDDDDDDEEEDDDDEEAPDASKQVCDSLQDTMRATRLIMKTDDGAGSRYFLPKDSPWQGLAKESVFAEAPGQLGAEASSEKIVFTDDAIHLRFPQPCHALDFLEQGTGDYKLQCFSVDGVIFGRLPIFGHPHDPKAEAAGDGGDDDDDDMDDATQKNEQLMAYRNTFGLVDRSFVFEALRDCLIAHRPIITKTGLLQGTPKQVAEELMSIRYLLTNEPTCKGLEYAIIETVFGLIAQASDLTPLRRTFLSRVLLELVRLHPGELSPALAMGMTNLFGDYIPALSPSTQENFSQWFAFHLSNTEYQWPAAFWTVWAPSVTSTKFNARGQFLKQTITAISENTTSIRSIIDDCLPKDSPLVASISSSGTLPLAAVPKDGPIAAIGRDINDRVWGTGDAVEELIETLTSNEASESVSPTINYEGDSLDQCWWRTCVATRVVFDPLRQDGDRRKAALEKALNPSDDDMDEQEQSDPDTLGMLKDSLSNYSRMITSAITEDSKALNAHHNRGENLNEYVLAGEVYILEQIDSLGGYSRGMVEACIQLLIQHEIVSCLAVARWMLGYENVNSVQRSPIDRWWTMGCLATRLCVLNAIDKNKNGMASDTDAANGDQQAASQILNELMEIIKHVVKKAESLWESTPSEKNERLGLVHQCRNLLSFSRKMAAKEIAASKIVPAWQLDSLLVDAFEPQEAALRSLAERKF